ncbi:hypothetical protein [Streptomyces sp. ISL-100]|uniref:hypothetical protein n=1 Tax=Streptomyces sp. ISL-100 TaxID=2819173 RepID=UPI001BEA88B2|nr:hypothetical protein [Streptomyces sp. ISL-100]MBT2398710.1 hypothetical protein [Streptomyces sp. ISL-100]
MGDADLIINVDVLVTSEKRLGTLKSEFETIDKQKDHMRQFWGSGEIADAMDEFVDNWENYREKFIQNIDSLGKMVTAAINGFDGLDKELADRARKKD